MVVAIPADLHDPKGEILKKNRPQVQQALNSPTGIFDLCVSFVHSSVSLLYPANYLIFFISLFRVWGLGFWGFFYFICFFFSLIGFFYFCIFVSQTWHFLSST